MLGYCENLLIPTDFPIKIDNASLLGNYFYAKAMAIKKDLVATDKQFTELDFDEEGNIVKQSVSRLSKDGAQAPLIIIGNDASIEEQPCQPDMLGHWHHQIEISMAVSGEGSYFIANKEVPMKKGDIIIFNIMSPHAWKANEELPLIVKNFYISPRLLFSSYYEIADDALDNIFNDKIAGIFISELSEYSMKLSQLLFAIEDEYVNKKPGYRLMMKSHLFHFVSNLYRYYHNHFAKDDNTLVNNISPIKNIIEYIAENYKEQITLKTAAKIACMSPSYFSHIFSKNMNMPFNAYLSQYRVTCAAKLLMSSSMSIIEIAEESGFSSLSNFYKAFRMFYGISPKEYRTSKQSTSSISR